jgi:hypothetical protein
MALKKTMVVNKFGSQLTFNDAYLSAQSIFVEQVRLPVKDSIGRQVVIDGVPQTEIKWRGQCELQCFTSREAKYAGAEPFDHIPVAFDLNPDNQNTVHAFVYGLVKQDPRFADAVDA